MKNQCSGKPKRNSAQKFQPVTHVIFDLDGIILDSEHIYKEALTRALEDYGHPLKTEFYKEVSGAPTTYIANHTIKRYSLDVSSDDFITKYRHYSREFLKDVSLIPGAEKIIRHLHKNNIPMAIATSSAKESYQRKTEPYKDLFDLFEHVVCCEDPEVKHGKPKPDPYLVCASRFESKPDPAKCLVFEDSGNGVEAALAAGMQVVMVPSPYTDPEKWKQATLKIDSLDVMKPEWFGLPPFDDEDHDSSTDTEDA